jgi:hypothetical protein
MGVDMFWVMLSGEWNSRQHIANSTSVEWITHSQFLGTGAASNESPNETYSERE